MVRVPSRFAHHVTTFFPKLDASRAHGVKSNVPAATTFQYPEQERPYSRRHRSRRRLTKRQADTPRCVECMMCETICPAFCVFIVEGEHPDPNIEKHAPEFDIDYGKCIFCGSLRGGLPGRCHPDGHRDPGDLHRLAPGARMFEGSALGPMGPNRLVPRSDRP